MTNTLWTLAGKSERYFYWLREDTDKPLYNCTTTEQRPGSDDGGYHSLDSLRKLKNDDTALTKPIPKPGRPKCNRTRCDMKAHPLLIHRDNRQAYCPSCARKINEFARLDGHEPLIPWPSLQTLQVYENACRHAADTEGDQ